MASWIAHHEGEGDCHGDVFRAARNRQCTQRRKHDDRGGCGRPGNQCQEEPDSAAMMAGTILVYSRTRWHTGNRCEGNTLGQYDGRASQSRADIGLHGLSIDIYQREGNGRLSFSWAVINRARGILANKEYGRKTQCNAGAPLRSI